jgi:hypothetical protein
MIKLYCQCGYPIWVSARWTGVEVLLVLYDGHRRPDRGAPAPSICPQWHRKLVPADLHERPIPPRYFPPD